MDEDLKDRVVDTLTLALASLVTAIDVCIEGKLILPGLMLVYAGIDSVGALEKRQGEGVKDSFVRWADSYLLKARSLGCTALDLYAARCGILHTMAAESNLSRSGHAARILYAWGLQKQRTRRGPDRLYSGRGTKPL